MWLSLLVISWSSCLLSQSPDSLTTSVLSALLISYSPTSWHPPMLTLKSHSHPLSSTLFLLPLQLPLPPSGSICSLCSFSLLVPPATGFHQDLAALVCSEGWGSGARLLFSWALVVLVRSLSRLSLASLPLKSTHSLFLFASPICCSVRPTAITNVQLNSKYKRPL